VRSLDLCLDAPLSVVSISPQAKKDAAAKKRKKPITSIWPYIWRYFWGQHQRFFRSLCISCKVPALLTQVVEALALKKCCVIGLQSTGEARTQDAVTEGEELEDFISTPGAILDKVIEQCLPLPVELDVWAPPPRPRSPADPLSPSAAIRRELGYAPMMNDAFAGGRARRRAATGGDGKAVLSYKEASDEDSDAANSDDSDDSDDLLVFDITAKPSLSKKKAARAKAAPAKAAPADKGKGRKSLPVGAASDDDDDFGFSKTALLEGRSSRGSVASEASQAPQPPVISARQPRALRALADTLTSGARDRAPSVVPSSLAATSSSSSMVGRLVEKKFPGHGLFKGRVASEDLKAGLYTVVYEDGDEEDLNLDELVAVLAEGLGAAATTAARHDSAATRGSSRVRGGRGGAAPVKRASAAPPAKKRRRKLSSDEESEESEWGPSASVDDDESEDESTEEDEEAEKERCWGVNNDDGDNDGPAAPAAPSTPVKLLRLASASGGAIVDSDSDDAIIDLVGDDDGGGSGGGGGGCGGGGGGDSDTESGDEDEAAAQVEDDEDFAGSKAAAAAKAARADKEQEKSDEARLSRARRNGLTFSDCDKCRRAMARVRRLRKAVRSLVLPGNPLDVLINELGGPDFVAELTGRKTRMVRDTLTGKVTLESRNTNGQSLEGQNLYEKAEFMAGRKVSTGCLHRNRLPQQSMCSQPEHVSSCLTTGLLVSHPPPPPPTPPPSPPPPPPPRRSPPPPPPPGVPPPPPLSVPLSAAAPNSTWRSSARPPPRGSRSRRTGGSKTSAAGCTSRSSCRGPRTRRSSSSGGATGPTRPPGPSTVSSSPRSGASGASQRR